MALLVLSGVAAIVSQAAEAEPFERLGVFRPVTVPPGRTPEAYAQSINLFAEPGSRRLFTIGDEGFIAAYDLDSLQPVGAGLQGPGRPSMVVADPAMGSLLVAYESPIQGGILIDQIASTPGGVARVARLNVTTIVGGRQVVGLYRLPNSSTMWIAADALGAGGVMVAELTMPGLDLSRATGRWSKELPECPSLVRANSAVPAGIGYVARTSSLYMACGNRNFDPASPRGVLRLEVLGTPASGATTPGALHFFPRAGDFSTGSSVFDPVTGRVIFDSYTAAGGAGASVYVFDPVEGRYVGGVAAGKNSINAVGFDPVRGRYYALSINTAVGLLASDIRLTPPDQGATGGSFAGGSSSAANNAPVAVDPSTSRLFLKYGSGEILVVRDRHPSAPSRQAPDPDSQTMDVEEVPGVTQRAFSGAGQGYGARYRQIGGVQAFSVNLTNFDGRVFPIGYGTREVKTAYLERVAVANSEASAAAIAAERDIPNTQADLDKTAPQNPESGEPVGDTNGPLVRWPFTLARCADFGDKPDVQQVEGAKTSCVAAAHAASAAAQSGRADGDIVVGSSSLDARSFLDPERGVVTGVSSTARDISALGGAIHIGEVTATAESWAKGRRRSAGTSYTTVVKDVVLGGQKICSAPCDREAVAREINRRFLGRARAEAPVAYQEATPGGYAAVVRRDPIQHIEEIVLNEQPADRIEVPALVITFAQDGVKPSRTVLELAGVETEARYGITVAGSGGGGGGGGTDGPGGVGTGELGVGDGAPPLFGLGSPLAPADPSASPRPAVNDGPVADLGRFLWNGLKSLRLLPIWAILLAPVYLSARRWLLLERARLLSGGRS